MTFEAFKTFHKVLIRKLKIQVSWTILRYYGYDSDLRIVRNLWDDGSITDEVLDGARAFELKRECLAFLSTIFKSHKASSRSQKIDLAAIDKIFATTELGSCPWDVLKETAYDSRQGNFGAAAEQQDNAGVPVDRNFESSGGVTIENWISLWIKYF